MVIGILAHVDAGKTTLSESILYHTGSIRKMGRVDHGDAFLDTDRIEKERGISVRLVNESYTSQTCPHCGKRHKPANRNFECSCGYYAHRDLVGAWNILNKKYSFELKPFIIQTKQPLYLKPKKYRPSEVVVA